MTLSRLVTYTDGNTLTGAQLNAEFDNILNNGPSLVTLSIPAYSAVSGLTGSIVTNIGSFSANAYQLKSTSVICSLSATSSYSINTQTAGPIANGRDQAAAFGSTDVHFYAITTGGTSTNAAGICSTRPPNIGPTLPAGYTAWAYLASAKYSTGTSAVSAIDGGLVTGSRVTRPGTAYDVTSSPVAFSSYALTAAVPQIAGNFEAGVRLQGIYASTGSSLVIVQGVYADSVGSFGQSFALTIAATSTLPAAPYAAFSNLNLPNVNTPPALYIQNIITNGTSGTVAVRVLSYTCPNGDAG